jgi:hypothetical protein
VVADSAWWPARGSGVRLGLAAWSLDAWLRHSARGMLLVGWRAGLAGVGWFAGGVRAVGECASSERPEGVVSGCGIGLSLTGYSSVETGVEMVWKSTPDLCGNPVHSTLTHWGALASIE